MKLIFYKEAADHLQTTPDSIAHAVKRGSLTRAGHKGKNSLLIEEQVLLFKGERNGRKKWVSLQDLTPSEKREWDRYAREAQAHETGASQNEIKAMVRQELNQELAPLLEEITTLDSEEEAAKQRLAAIQGQKEGFRKALSILRARAIA